MIVKDRGQRGYLVGGLAADVAIATGLPCSLAGDRIGDRPQLHPYAIDRSRWRHCFFDARHYTWLELLRINLAAVALLYFVHSQEDSQ